MPNSGQSKALHDLLEENYRLFNSRDFISGDPISIPHRFKHKNDIEIAAFLTSAISWGNRKSIITNSMKLMHLMDNAPFDFVINHRSRDLIRLKPFVHRTFNSEDAMTFIQKLKDVYIQRGGLENLFPVSADHEENLRLFPGRFFEDEDPGRSKKHVANISTGSAAKRLNMFLRWMVRKDDNGVDFGIWKNISQKDLFIPLDVHSGNSARKLKLLSRRQNDWKAVKLLTEELRHFDPSDPVKYDFALFGLGVNRKFI